MSLMISLMMSLMMFQEIEEHEVVMKDNDGEDVLEPLSHLTTLLNSSVRLQRVTDTVSRIDNSNKRDFEGTSVY